MDPNKDYLKYVRRLRRTVQSKLVDNKIVSEFSPYSNIASTSSNNTDSCKSTTRKL